MGLIVSGSLTMPCAIGRNGIGPKRHEGDGRTPIGLLALVGWRRRKEKWRVFRPESRVIARWDGWCDDPGSNGYNRAVVLPFRARAENLWRVDGLYDVIGILDFNFDPRIKGRGSAIFFHLAHEDFQPTAGCIAVRRSAMRMKQLTWSAKLMVHIS
jgi:L,D-peptidoglycan transpeptidase YkuD (ErfK/YbiS/YcfS/YnhG family)